MTNIQLKYLAIYIYMNTFTICYTRIAECLLIIMNWYLCEVKTSLIEINVRSGVRAYTHTVHNASDPATAATIDPGTTSRFTDFSLLPVSTTATESAREREREGLIDRYAAVTTATTTERQHHH